MGIRYLLTWLKENFGNCFKALPATSGNSGCAALYVDFNAVLYQCVAHEQSRRLQGGSDVNPAHGREAALAAFEAQVLSLVTNAMDATIAHVLSPVSRSTHNEPVTSALKRVFIAVDGVSPHGKTAQQRNRRASRSSARVVKLGGNIEWEMSAITPGTALMHRVSALLEWYAFSRVRQWADVEIIVSDASVPGEGEHKIFEALRAAPPVPLAGPVCICSNDTDVVLGATQFSDDPRYMTHGLNVLRCDVSDVSTIRAEGAVFDIQQFRDALCEKLGWSTWRLNFAEGRWDPAEESGFTDAFRDVLFAFLLFGNDFVPRLQSIDISGGSLDDILDFVRSNFTAQQRHIVQPKTLQIDLSAAQYLLAEIVRVAHAHQVMINDAIEAAAAKRHRSEGLSVTLAPGVSTDDWTRDTKSKRQWTPKEIEQCAKYWDGLQWTVKYYCGECPSWRWAYPYENAPSEEALCHCMSSMRLDYTPPTLPLTQMLLVLTGAARQTLLPKAIAAALNVSSTELKASSGGANDHRNRILDEVRLEVEKDLHEQNLDLLEQLTAVMTKSLSPLEQLRLRVGRVYRVVWRIEMSSLHSDSALAGEDRFELADDIALRVFRACRSIQTLPGINDGLDLAKMLTEKLSRGDNATTLSDQTKSIDQVAWRTIDGLVGDRIERLSVADPGLRAAAIAVDVVNSSIVLNGGRAWVVIEPFA